MKWLVLVLALGMFAAAGCCKVFPKRCETRTSGPCGLADTGPIFVPAETTDRGRRLIETLRIEEREFPRDPVPTAEDMKSLCCNRFQSTIVNDWCVPEIAAFCDACPADERARCLDTDRDAVRARCYGEALPVFHREHPACGAVRIERMECAYGDPSAPAPEGGG